jgi:hypothetical protein
VTVDTTVQDNVRHSQELFMSSTNPITNPNPWPESAREHNKSIPHKKILYGFGVTPTEERTTYLATSLHEANHF